MPVQGERQSRNRVFAIVSVLIGLLIPLALAEIALRFLPVGGGLMAEAVDERHPVFHFTPNRQSIWSRDWKFSIVNSVRVNNIGYVNDQDYDATDTRPLCAVVGDSYVEALMVPYAETLHGRLAADAPQARIYSFAASGAPLSQYLVWARDAHERWHANALAIVVVGNDWDESLTAYKIDAGYHHYVVGPDGSLALRRFDYAPSWWRKLVRKSALGRYLFFNLQAPDRLKLFLRNGPAFLSAAHAPQYVGNTAAAADAERLERSEAVIDTFLRDLVVFSGWSPNRVVFVVDGIRYPSNDPTVLGSYFVQMRNYFMTAARAAGFEVVDMDQRFFARFRVDGKRFEFPTDAHWNALGHTIAAEALAASAVFSRCLQGTLPASAE